MASVWPDTANLLALNSSCNLLYRFLHLIGTLFEITCNTRINAAFVCRFLDFSFDIIRSISELTHSFTQTSHYFRQLIRPEYEDHDKNDKKDFSSADKKRNHKGTNIKNPAAKAAGFSFQFQTILTVELELLIAQILNLDQPSASYCLRCQYLLFLG